MKTELPIYKATYELLVLILDCTSTFPRNYKRTLSERMMDLILNLVIKINEANNASGEEKLPHIREIINDIKMVEILVRASTDMKLISIAKQSVAVTLTDSVRKQAHGWEKYVKDKSANKRAAFPKRHRSQCTQKRGV